MLAGGGGANHLLGMLRMRRREHNGVDVLVTKDRLQ
jgi:hypothetical protein